MTDKRLTITSNDAAADREDRFHRFRLIGWWDQTRLARAKVLVVGAGALGNELIKNLALLGVGNLFVADLDRIENSNLSRSILFRESDNGQHKAETAARAAKEIYPNLNVQFFNGDVIHDLGVGVFRWADMALAGLDNREARLAINRNCWKVGVPWIDGAIEQIQGCARVFVPDGPCYECTMSDVDWQILNQRRSCNLLTREEMQGGRTPTTPTISAVVAGVQCQEAVKLLHGMETMSGQGWFFEGLSGESFRIEYQKKDDCLSHDMLDEVISLDAGRADITAGALLETARRHLGPKVELELCRDMVESLVCPKCGVEESVFNSLGQIRAERAWCPDCRDVRREVKTFYKIRGTESFLDQNLETIGVPAYDIIVARAGERSVGFELSGDASHVLGPLAAGEDDLEWT